MNNIKQIISDNLNGLTFIGMDTETTVKLKGGKKNIFQGRVTKRTTGISARIAQNMHTNAYVNSVRKGLELEGKSADDFQLSPRKWGVKIENTPFIENKGQYYLEVDIQSVGEVQVLLDGEVVDKSTIEGYPASRVEAKQGDLEDKIILRDFKVESITTIRINKQQYSDLVYEA